MTHRYSREVLAVVWVFVFAAAGAVVSISSLSGWLVLATLAIVPAIVFLMFSGHRSQQTMSESIQKALR